MQSYNPRRRVPRGDISIAHLEECLAKASYSAVQNSGSLSLYTEASEFYIRSILLLLMLFHLL